MLYQCALALKKAFPCFACDLYRWELVGQGDSNSNSYRALVIQRNSYSSMVLRRNNFVQSLVTTV